MSLSSDNPADFFLPEDAVDMRVAASGRIDPRNTLNDLTGSQWVYFLNSIWHTKFKRVGNGAHAFDQRSEHPSPKPPGLLADIIRFFTKEGGKVLDPFAGVGSTLLACSLTGRNGYGMELNPDYVQIYREVCARYPDHYQEMIMIPGDARQIAAHEQIVINAPYHLVVADPPYSNMLARPRTRAGSNSPTPFTTEEADLGNIAAVETETPPYAPFLRALKEVVTAACSLLYPKGHLVIFCKDFQPTSEYHNLLHADVVAELYKIGGLTYEGMRIWNNAEPKLYPFGYPFAFVANQIHQYILVFRRDGEIRNGADERNMNGQTGNSDIPNG